MPIKRDRFVGSQLVDAFVLSSRFTRWIVIFHLWLENEGPLFAKALSEKEAIRSACECALRNYESGQAFFSS
jgi:hypothetical protein